eukprot:TRINITY_DN6331_c0_g1_i3.p1 TRINITY_DN6331_c0_g1~~TRINITY_DN6331_c0_g1_i3.p1  ORF type:complete len:329 (-),score=62.22 TRINITY_DN6331_c0_g1_i3:45-1031(-)
MCIRDSPRTPAKEDPRGTSTTTGGIISPGVIRVGSPIRQASPVRLSSVPQRTTVSSRPPTTGVVRMAAPVSVQAPVTPVLQAPPQYIQAPVMQAPIVQSPLIQALPQVIVPDKNYEVLPVTEGGFVNTPYPLNFTWVDTGMAAAEQTVDYDLLPVGYNYEVLSERRIDDANPEYQSQIQNFNSGPVSNAPIQPVEAYNAVPLNSFQPAPGVPMNYFQPQPPQLPPPMVPNGVAPFQSPVRYSAAPVRYSAAPRRLFQTDRFSLVSNIFQCNMLIIDNEGIVLSCVLYSWQQALVHHSSQKTNRKKKDCLLYTSPSPRDGLLSRMPSSA